MKMFACANNYYHRYASLKMSGLPVILLAALVSSLGFVCLPTLAADDQTSYQASGEMQKGDKPLKGRVEHHGDADSPEPLKKQSPWIDMNQPDGGDEKLQGKAQSDWEEDKQLRPGQAKPEREMLKGYASSEGLDGQAGMASEDPDVDDSELMIEWDRWRNRFLRAVQKGMQYNLNSNFSEENLRYDPQRHVMVSAFPNGTEAWFYCQITNDRRIVRSKIVRSSGFKNYDRALLLALDNLQGSSILRYPKGSKRVVVEQVAGVVKAETAQDRYFHFGDVEHQRIPGNQ